MRFSATVVASNRGSHGWDQRARITCHSSRRDECGSDILVLHRSSSRGHGFEHLVRETPTCEFAIVFFAAPIPCWFTVRSARIATAWLRAIRVAVSAAGASQGRVFSLDSLRFCGPFGALGAFASLVLVRTIVVASLLAFAALALRLVLVKVCEDQVVVVFFAIEKVCARRKLALFIALRIVTLIVILVDIGEFSAFADREYARFDLLDDALITLTLGQRREP